LGRWPPVVVVVKALVGWLGRRPDWADDRLGMIYTIVIDIQFLIGLILWFADHPIFVSLRAMGNPLRVSFATPNSDAGSASSGAHWGALARAAWTSRSIRPPSSSTLSFLFIVLISIMRLNIR
jgi:hypothetical protein